METPANNHPTPTRILLSVKQMAQKYPAFTEAALRNLIFKSKPIVMSRGTKPGNGLDAALIRIGGKIIIDEAKFMQWLDSQNGKRNVK